VATKKQKRQAALAKHEEWLNKRRETGLQAQAKDKERRRQKKRDEQREKHNKEHSWKTLDKDCVLCQDKMEDARRRERLLNEVATDG
jgi:hypothetical protein